MASSTGSSASEIGCSDDLLLEILIFLPVITLIRFKSVSKQWCSLLSAPYLRHRHCRPRCLCRSKRHFSFILKLTESQYFVCSYMNARLIPLTLNFPFMKIIHSSNGLLLLRSRNQYYVCNSTTEQSRKLLLRSSERPSDVCLIFNPEDSPHYKVVFIFSDHLLLYSSGTNQWKREAKSFQFSNWKRRFIRGFFGIGFVFARPRYMSLRWRPTHRDRRIGHPYLKNYRGKFDHFCFWLQLSFGSGGYTQLESFEQDSEHFHEHFWDQRYSASIDIGAKVIGSSRAEMHLVGLLRGESVEDSIVFIHAPGKILFFRLCDEVCRVMIDFTKEENLSITKEDKLRSGVGGIMDAHSFMETLAPV